MDPTKSDMAAMVHQPVTYSRRLSDQFSRTFWHNAAGAAKAVGRQSPSARTAKFELDRNETGKAMAAAQASAEISFRAQADQPPTVAKTMARNGRVKPAELRQRMTEAATIKMTG